MQRNPTSKVWVTAGGDNTRRGLDPRSLEIDWNPSRTLRAEGAVQASVVFDGEGRALVADMAGWVRAFSGEGELLWRCQLRGGVWASPAVHPVQPRLFIGTVEGWAYALETTSGKVCWRKEIPSESDPRILSDLLCVTRSNTVVLSSWGGKFVALDVATGAERFSWSAGIAPSAAAAADGEGNIYSLRAVTGRGVELVRVDPRGVERVLHAEPEGARGARRAVVSAAPVWDEERGQVSAVINRDQDALWLSWSVRAAAVVRQEPLSNLVTGTPVVFSDGTAVLADRAGFVVALNGDGSLRYRYATGCEYLLAGAVAEQGGTVFVADPLGMVHAVDRVGMGRPVFEARRSVQARPSFDAWGNLFIPSTDRLVYVFAAKSG